MNTSHAHPPQVSIGLPVYNGEKYLAAALDSLLAQTWSDLEVVISDNGSSDGTEAICRRYAERDERVQYFRGDINRGAAWNFNRVVELARGAYFRWAAYDDLCDPTLIERLLSVLEDDPQAVLCASAVEVIDGEGRIIPGELGGNEGEPLVDDYGPPRTTLLGSERAADRFRGVLLHSMRCYEEFGLIRRAAILRTGLHRPYRGAEKVFLAELSLLGPFRIVPQVLFYSRWHDERFSALPSARAQNEWVVAKPRRWMMPRRLRCALGYTGLVFKARGSFRDRLGSARVLLQFVFRWQKLKAAVHEVWRGSAMTAVPLPPSREPDSQECHLDAAEPLAGAAPGGDSVSNKI